MRVALFFDGKNFYKSLSHHSQTLEIDYDKFAAWLVTQVKGTHFAGAFYYTGYTSRGSQRGAALNRWLSGLDWKDGYFVRRAPRVRRTAKCRNCGHTYEYTSEKQVDSLLVADLIHHAAANTYDIAILLSGDQDLVPAVDAVRLLGRQVYVASWAGAGRSKALRRACFGEIDLVAGITDFETGRQRAAPAMGSGSPSSAPPVVKVSQPAELLAELADAERHFKSKGSGYVGLSYFLTKWRPKRAIPMDAPGRQTIVDELQADGKIEIYEIQHEDKQVQAIRCVE